MNQAVLQMDWNLSQEVVWETFLQSTITIVNTLPEEVASTGTVLCDYGSRSHTVITENNLGKK